MYCNGRLLYRTRWWQLKYFFIFTPKIGEDSHFDEYFSNGLKPPPSELLRQMLLMKTVFSPGQKTCMVCCCKREGFIYCVVGVRAYHLKCDSVVPKWRSSMKCWWNNLLHQLIWWIFHYLFFCWSIPQAVKNTCPGSLESLLHRFASPKIRWKNLRSRASHVFSSSSTSFVQPRRGLKASCSHESNMTKVFDKLKEVNFLHNEEQFNRTFPCKKCVWHLIPKQAPPPKSRI